MMNAGSRWSFLAVPVLAALGCSDPVPLPNQGAITLSVQKVSTAVAGKDCPVPGRIYEIGAPKAPSKVAFGDSAIDGQKGATIKCTVRGNGPFTFSGSIHGTSNDGNLVTVTFTSGQINADKTTGTATVSVYTPQLAGNLTSAASACTINVINQQVKPGSLWASFSCPGISAPPNQLCAIGDSSVVVFENCEGT